MWSTHRRLCATYNYWTFYTLIFRPTDQPTDPFPLHRNNNRRSSSSSGSSRESPVHRQYSTHSSSVAVQLNWVELSWVGFSSSIFVWKRMWKSNNNNIQRQRTKSSNSGTITVLCAQQSVLVDSLCYLLSSVSRDSALNKNSRLISPQCAHQIPHHEHSTIYWNERTNEMKLFFWCGRGQLLFFCDAMMKAFLRSTTRKLAKLNWVGSIRFEKPTEAQYILAVWVMNVSCCCCCCYVVVRIRPHHLGSDEIQDGGHIFSVSLIVPNWPNFFFHCVVRSRRTSASAQKYVHSHLYFGCW